jgi:integrase
MTWAMLTGRRVNEYRAMRVCDVSLTNREYKVVGTFDQEVWKPFPKVKGRAGAAFPMDDEMVAVVREALEGRVYGPQDYVFINPSTGRAYTHKSLGCAFEKARKRVGIDITMNEFGRHSWATQKLAEGWSFSEVAIFLLDAVATVENNYANVTKATRRAVLTLKQGLDTSRTQVFRGFEEAK